MTWQLIRAGHGLAEPGQSAGGAGFEGGLLDLVGPVAMSFPPLTRRRGHHFPVIVASGFWYPASLSSLSSLFWVGGAGHVALNPIARKS